LDIIFGKKLDSENRKDLKTLRGVTTLNYQTARHQAKKKNLKKSAKHKNG